MCVQYQRFSSGNGATLIFQSMGLACGRMSGRMNVPTDSHVTNKTFEIQGLPNFPSYGAPLTRLRRAEAPL